MSSARRGRVPSGGQESLAEDESATSPTEHRRDRDRTSQACIKCRAQKMRCIGAHDPPCHRCRRVGVLCEFVPRANARAAPSFSPTPFPAHSCSEVWRGDVSTRIASLEKTNARLCQMVERLMGGSKQDVTTVPSQLPALTHFPAPLNDRAGLWQALEELRAELPSTLATNEAWKEPNVSVLWDSFHKNMPGLHFLSGQVSFTRPTPILAVSVLYVAAAHYPSPRLAKLQPAYLEAFERAIGALVVRSAMAEPATRADERFNDVLGIILVGLLSIGWVSTVGLWVNTGFRLLLDGMTEEKGQRFDQWNGLWEGLRTIEVEHVSLHLTCPALPSTLPDPLFSSQLANQYEPNSASSAIGKLHQIMQKRMQRFVGRGLPTAWDLVCSSSVTQTQVSVTGDDIAATKRWVADIDEWYTVHSRMTTQASAYVRTIILLNYHLHKLFVLSLFMPRGAGTLASPELFESSRLVLKIETAGFNVWSSWDLVMMTTAALITLDSFAGRTGSSNDLFLVQHHLNVLKSTHQAAPSLRHTLFQRLESALQGARAPTADIDPALSSEAAYDLPTWTEPNIQYTPGSGIDDLLGIDPLNVFSSDGLDPDFALPSDGLDLRSVEWPALAAQHVWADEDLAGPVQSNLSRLYSIKS
ncbi:hypothetical protein BCR39DRAFT_590107 [Naematelia encephala]|uniref:Zn(2)-C6 fungal-type domain-containing protein n=1 Tax=Naematelia encephala TaxID=71784 RepID=A0A1Y2ASL9_9TREE|nr:hypothetical protein BCR39DRAFT_590107 [Naematelia encephala]